MWFFVGVLGLIAILPLFFLSLEHLKLGKRFGAHKGKKIGALYGRISGWLFFLFWIGIWISPQPRFVFPILKNGLWLPVISISLPLFHLFIFIPLIIIAVWMGIKAVRHVSLKVAETHRPEKIIKTGFYSVIRHPQYVAGLIAHLGITFLLSGLYSLFLLPFMILYIYIISRKEEKELINEFGDEYLSYMEKVPMFIPRFRKKMRFNPGRR